MHHHKWFFLIILFVLVPCFSVAGELIIHSSDGVETLTFPDSQSSNMQPDNYRKISEKCISNCDEIAAPPKPAPKSSAKKGNEGVVIGIVQAQPESQSQWQIPVFKDERRRRDVDSDRLLAPVVGGAVDQTGKFYKQVGPNTYLDLGTGNIIIGPSFGRIR